MSDEVPMHEDFALQNSAARLHNRFSSALNTSRTRGTMSSLDQNRSAGMVSGAMLSCGTVSGAIVSRYMVSTHIVS